MAVAMTVAAVSTAGFWSSGYTAGAVTDPDESLRDKYQRTASLSDHLDSESTASPIIATAESVSASVDDVVVPQDRGGMTTYTVQTGDTVSEIARAHGLSTWTLVRANGLQNPDLIYAGDILIIPDNDGLVHEVQPGETLRSIANLHGVSMEGIINYELNEITDPDLIFPGQVFFIPNANPPSTPASSAPASGDSSTTVETEPEPQLQQQAQPEPESAPPPVGVDYEVRAGDTLDLIAERHAVSAGDIVGYGPNGISNPNLIQPGQVLFIPNGVLQPEPVVEDPVVEIEVEVEAEAPVAVESAPAPQAEPPPAPVEVEPEPEPEPEPVAATGVGTGSFAWPVDGVITQRFGVTSFAQSSGWYGPAGHTGLDISARMNTPIYAADGGTVVVSGWSGGYGYAVAIDHGNGFVTWYAHMANQPPVSVGQQVAQGDHIGPIGSTGYSTGPHLHFEIRKNGTYMDPLLYLR